nr:sulfotransferase family 2 domain-containing protein [Zhihengliuella flava]
MNLKPKIREVLRARGIDGYKFELESYLSRVKDDFSGQVDYLAFLLKNEEYASFRNYFETLGKLSRRPRVARLMAKYLMFVEGDYEQARGILAGLSQRDPMQPAWVHYFGGVRKPYYTRLHDGLLYTAIPKNASTSLKTFILRSVQKVDDSRPHEGFGNPFFSFQSYSAEELESSLKVLILRRPEDRLVSYHGKNIIGEDSLAYEYGLDSSEVPDLFGLKLQPTLEEFLDNFARYCLVFNDVFHHSLPQAAYIGDLSTYDYIYDVSEVNELVVQVGLSLGMAGQVAAEAPREMVGTRKKKELDPDITRRLKDLYSDDYAALSFASANPKLSNGVRAYAGESCTVRFLK